MWFLWVGVVACGGSSAKLPPTITLDPTGVVVKVDETVDVAASFVDANGVKTAADGVTFSVAGSTVASVAGGANGHATIHGLAVGKTLLTVTAEDTSATFAIMVTNGDVPDVTLTAIEVTPSMKSIALGTTQQMTATGLFSDGTKQDLTAAVTWTSSAAAIATVSAAGVATSVAVGTTMITASKDTLSGTTQLTVADADLVSIAVAAASVSLAAGRTQQFTATGTFTNQTTQDLTTQVAWTSSAAAVATISTAGLATAVAPGAATITATKGTVAGSTGLTVTNAVLTAIVVSPDTASLAKGTGRAFVATGTFSNATTQVVTDQVTWTSSDGAVASVSDVVPTKGEAKALTAGTTTITATLDTVSGTATLTVTDAALVSLEVAPSTASQAIGHSQAFHATGTFSDTTTQDLTTQVVWSTSSAAIATVSNATDAGVAKAVALGTATITATSDAITASADLTVTPAVLDSITVAPATASLILGATQAFTATGNVSDGTTPDLTATATWTSSVATVATIAATGIATSVGAGTTTITATSAGVDGTATLDVAVMHVTALLPRDTAFGIRATTPIVITFDQTVATASIAPQGAAGPCTGGLQLSSDNFASCVGFTGPVVPDTTNKIATATPTALSASTTYKIRVTNAATNTAGGAVVPFTQAAGFTTAAAGTCAGGLVISQVYGGGGNMGSVFSNDFIELHNGGATPIDLTGFAVQFTSAGGASWGVQALPSVTLAAGGYFLIQEAAGNTPNNALPTPDFTPQSVTDGGPGIFAMGAGSGKVALTASTTALTGTCPVGLTNDFVGYGTAPAMGGCFEGTGSTSAPAAATAAIRKTAGCTDANDNKTDFAVATPTPRNAATAPSVCACFAGLADDGEPAMSFLSDN